VTDALGDEARFDYVLPVSHRLTADPIDYDFPTAAVGQPYSFAMTGRDGTAPYSFALVETGRVPDAIMGSDYSFTFLTTGGAAPYRYYPATPLPPGLLLHRDGTLVGDTSAAGTHELAIRVHDRDNVSITRTFRLDVLSRPDIALTPAPGLLPDGHVGGNYEQFIRVTGDPGLPGGPYSYSWSENVPGLRMYGHNGRLFGVPTEAGIYEISVYVAEFSTLRRLGEYHYTLHIGEPDYLIALEPPPGPLPDGMIGVPYEQSISASGTQGAHSFRVVGGYDDSSLIGGGLSIDAFTGRILGTPYWPGERAFTVEVEDESGYSARARYTIEVAPRPDSEPIAILPDVSTLTRPVIGEPYSVTFSAEGGHGEDHIFEITSALPDGLSFDPQTRTLSGVPTETGNFSFVVRVRDSVYNYGYRTYSIAPREALWITPPANPLPRANVREAYPEFQYFYANGGDGDYAFSFAGSLPAGMQISGLDGRFPMLAGTPTEYGTFAFTLTLSGMGPYPVIEDYTLVVDPYPLVIRPDELESGRVGAPYAQEPLTVTGASGAPSFSVSAGALPEGLELDPAIGAITGTPLSVGTADITIRVEDGAGGVGIRDYSILIAERGVIGFDPPAGPLASGWIACLATPSSSSRVRFPTGWYSTTARATARRPSRGHSPSPSSPATARAAWDGSPSIW
jgi:hypothetical protein